MLGTTFGANAMGSSTDTEEYWQSREKWTLTQLFNRTGYTSTKTGWRNDVYQLATVNQEIYDGRGNNKCLYEKILKVHAQYLREREALVTEEKRLARYQQYQADILGIREEHILRIKSLFENAVKNEWLLYEEPSQAAENWFDRQENSLWKILITSLMLVC